MKIGIIGAGAIGTYVRDQAMERGIDVRALLVRPDAVVKHTRLSNGVTCVSHVADLPSDIEQMIDCAGHAALRTYGPDILRRGTSLITVSLGALADNEVYHALEQAAIDGRSQLHLATGAIGALDCLRAARTGGLQRVVYTGRKPPQGWKGSPAEATLDLDNLTGGAQTHFEGCAKVAAIEYPKNANVAAAVALAGIGFDDTQVKLIADPAVTENIHQIQASGAFGSFSFEIKGRSLPDNPRSSALAAMSVLAALGQESGAVVFR